MTIYGHRNTLGGREMTLNVAGGILIAVLILGAIVFGVVGITHPRRTPGGPGVAWVAFVLALAAGISIIAHTLR
jgi:hypothetical protein